MAKRKRRSPHELYMQRSRSIYNNQKRRAKEYDVTVPYELSDLRELICSELGSICVYCNREITAKNFGVDHIIPISRGGSWEIQNIQICCVGCNGVKGSLTDIEFRELLAWTEMLPDQVATDVLARLRSGGGRYGNSK